MFQSTLLYKTFKTYILVGSLLYLFLLAYWYNYISFYNLLNVTVFASYAGILYFSCNKPDSFYTSSRLCTTVFLYSIVVVSSYMVMSDYYTGNTFLFSTNDARIYEKYSFHIKDLSFEEAFSYISRILNYEDWGAPMTMAFILKIIPSKIFLNCCYVIMNTISAFCLFDIGKSIMSKQYAFIAVLTYTISSYALYFCGTFLKEEIMLFGVILSFFLFYRYWHSKKLLYALGAIIAAVFIVFFRPAILLFILAAFFSLLLLGEKSNIKVMFFLLILILAFVGGIALIQTAADKYIAGGNVDETYMFKNTTLFQKVVISIGAILGPFPELLQVTETLRKVPLYGAGLLLKFVLFFAFWKGAIYAIRSREVEVYPLLVFSLLETFALVLVFELELRKFLPHIPFYILLAFWYIDKYDQDADENIRKTPYYIWSNREFNICMFLVFFICLFWNILKV